jgi:insertion element IS1 protein InsB
MACYLDQKLNVISDDWYDYFSVYYETIPYRQHCPVGKESGKTSYIERFNCTLRQRCSRLVRKTLSFPKKFLNHVGMILYFVCDYNLPIQALHV